MQKRQLGLQGMLEPVRGRVLFRYGRFLANGVCQFPVDGNVTHRHGPDSLRHDRHRLTPAGVIGAN